MLLKRYGYYVILLGLAGAVAAVYVAAAHGFSMLVALLIFYAVIVTGAGVIIAVMGEHTL